LCPLREAHRVRLVGGIQPCPAQAPHDRTSQAGCRDTGEVLLVVEHAGVVSDECVAPRLDRRCRRIVWHQRPAGARREGHVQRGQIE